MATKIQYGGQSQYICMSQSVIGRESDETCLIVGFQGQEFQFQYPYDYKISIWLPKSNMVKFAYLGLLLT